MSLCGGLPVWCDVGRLADAVCRVAERLEILDETAHHELESELLAVGLFEAATRGRHHNTTCRRGLSPASPSLSASSWCLSDRGGPRRTRKRQKDQRRREQATFFRKCLCSLSASCPSSAQKSWISGVVPTRTSAPATAPTTGRALRFCRWRSASRPSVDTLNHQPSPRFGLFRRSDTPRRPHIGTPRGRVPPPAFRGRRR